MEGVRVRLQFEDRRILSKSQRKEGLKRSWIGLKPQHETVCDLASHILHAFELQDSCPHGLILSVRLSLGFRACFLILRKSVIGIVRRFHCVLEVGAETCFSRNLIVKLDFEVYQSSEMTSKMDGFVLPPFESTSVLKDKDVIWVRKKERSSTGTPRLGSGKNSVKALQVVEKQPVNTNLQLLANEEFIKETGGYKSESEEDKDEPSADRNNVENAANEDAGSKKRKASKKLKSPKRKKSRLANAEESPAACEGAGREEPVAEKETTQDNEILVRESRLEKDKSSDSKDRKDIASTSKNDGEVSVPSQSSPEGKGKGSVDASPAPSEAKEGQRGQSSGDDDWRKKYLGNNDQTVDSRDDQRKSEEHQQQHQSHITNAAAGNQQPHHDNSSGNGIVPVEIRPGHIRFEPFDEDADRPVQKSPVPVMTFQWNGVTDKKKGQKWGKEKGASKCQDVNQEPPQEASLEIQAHPSDSTDFTKLSPYGPVPQEGDIVAYRVIELSSSWTPEVSPFRVGKISSCNQGSKKIRLLPVPEHPFDLEKTDKALYGEDGSLEVDFSSLIDVRALKPNKSESAVAVGGQINETNVGNSNAVSIAQENKKNGIDQAPAQENGGGNVWEEISQALSAKKEQLSHEDRWRQKGTTTKGPPPSSYRGLRGSALGPIMALLRAQNAMQ
ncbi:hypothetical protein CDL15_Pgr009777 [Punica granatum]|uniref:Uncharacterized protein n=1 Tax=Punica granatum TaxID=22663 RepID=A0A218WV64_PUNGR|nr:hypothetical protein CDL15_Pgr009777 [Punica granatum]